MFSQHRSVKPRVWLRPSRQPRRLRASSEVFRNLTDQIEFDDFQIQTEAERAMQRELLPRISSRLVPDHPVAAQVLAEA